MDRRPAGQNNGRITQFNDGITGEVVNYTYDSLNRLIAATTSNNTGPVWGESYTYDGFGNLLSKVPTQGTAPQVYVPVNSQTNQVTPADANGNWLGSNSPQFAWDVENRMVFSGATDSASNWVTYSYDPWGKRVMQYASAGSASTVSTCVLYFYGANGKRLGTYNCHYSNGQFVVSTANINMYFGKKLFAAGSETNQNAVMTDRLGSVRGQNLSASIAYYPYGEERTSTPDNTDKFGTYFRDVYGQDYANQRYFTAVAGRFWNVDPAGLGAAHPNNPISWNHYAYAAGDPVNFYDPVGQDFGETECGGDAEDPCPASGDPGSNGNPGGGAPVNYTSADITGYYTDSDGVLTAIIGSTINNGGSDTGDQNLGPFDYINLTGSYTSPIYIGVFLSLTLDRSGTFYIGPGVTAGIPGPGATLTGGNLFPIGPSYSSSTVASHAGGTGVSVQGGNVGVFGVNWSPYAGVAPPISTQVGIGNRQFGVTVTYNFPTTTNGTSQGLNCISTMYGVCIQ